MIKIAVLIFGLVLIAGLVIRETLSTLHSSHGDMDHTSHMQEMASEERQTEVAERGEDVMPFNLHDTRHHFVKNAKGGIQQVLARDSGDVNQIQLVQIHLKEIREQFLQGDFSGPAHIHGNDMPGLRELQKSEPGQIKITYQEINSGAELYYETSNIELVDAIHLWFDAQLSDHGKDASHHHAQTHEEVQ